MKAFEYTVQYVGLWICECGATGMYLCMCTVCTWVCVVFVCTEKHVYTYV